MQMLVKDAASQMTKNFYRLILFSGIAEEEGAQDHKDVSEFFTGVPGAKPCNLYQNEEAF